MVFLEWAAYVREFLESPVGREVHWWAGVVSMASSLVLSLVAVGLGASKVAGAGWRFLFPPFDQITQEIMGRIERSYAPLYDDKKGFGVQVQGFQVWAFMGEGAVESYADDACQFGREEITGDLPERDLRALIGLVRKLKTDLDRKMRAARHEQVLADRQAKRELILERTRGVVPTPAEPQSSSTPNVLPQAGWVMMSNGRAAS